ncbi:MAG: diguanylate cyclase [Lachnospiraceae bacterium]
MKKQIALKLSAFVVSVLILLLIFNYFLQLSEVEHNTEASAQSTLDQIKDILTTNALDLDTLTTSLQDEYIIKAQMTAYILQNIDTSTTADYIDLATMLDIDEIHVFDTEGVIYEGTVPEYFGYSFTSGDQMQFFLPLLEDTNLTLCQDITPNTAESKPMMYIATWLPDTSAIVQIGIEPARILEEQSKNELSYIYASMPTDDHTVLLAVDAATNAISGSTEDIFLGTDLSDLGLTLTEELMTDAMFYATINGIDYLCIFSQYDETFLGVITEKAYITDSVFNSMIAISAYFTIVAVCLFFALLTIIDFTILQSIDLLIENVSKIAGGDLDTKVDIDSSKEFQKLSMHLNMMVSSLLNTTAQMSHVLDYVDARIAVYEYKNDMQRVFATRKLADLLNLSKNELDELLTDKTNFNHLLYKIKKNSTEIENVYLLGSDTYLQIETLSGKDGNYGVVVDVSETINQRKRLERERDYDVLTNLFNRRALLREVATLFKHPSILKESIIIALDMDNLKEINDTYGHDAGDSAIQYCAVLLRDIPVEHKLLCRLGGDEFVAILYGADDKETLLAHTMQLEIDFNHSHIGLDYGDAHIKMSAGYIFSSDYEYSYDNLIKCADVALYTAKRTGRSRFVEYKDSMNTQL